MIRIPNTGYGNFSCLVSCLGILGAKLEGGLLQVLLLPLLLLVSRPLLLLLLLQEGVEQLPLLAGHLVALHLLNLAGLVVLLGQLQHLCNTEKYS